MDDGKETKTISRDSIMESAKSQLGPNFKTGDDKLLKDISDMVIDEAVLASNRSETEETLFDLKAICIEAIKIAYQNRGAEGQKSQGELGQSNSFIHWSEYLENAIINKGKRFLM